jgi:hypothetical protein
MGNQAARPRGAGPSAAERAMPGDALLFRLAIANIRSVVGLHVDQTTGGLKTRCPSVVNCLTFLAWCPQKQPTTGRMKMRLGPFLQLD